MFEDYHETGPALLTDSNSKITGKFRISPTNVAIANTLRREILSSVKTVGFRTEPFQNSDIKISVNTGRIHNEMIAHRIGLIPVAVTEVDTFDPSQYDFELDVENTTNSMMDVTASDFKIYNRSSPTEEGILVPTEKVFPPDPITGSTVLITRLHPQMNPDAPKERLKLKIKASIGVGSDNIRWSPVSQCSYEYTMDENPEKIEAVFRIWLSKNKKIDDVTKVTAERMDELLREFKAMEIQRCYRVDERGEPNDFTFTIESVGILGVPAIVDRGIRACNELVSKYMNLNTALPPNVEIIPANSRMLAIDMVFLNEGHTLGNLLQTFLVKNHIENEEAGIKITYAGYKVPHPLEKKMVIRISTDGETIEEVTTTARQAIAAVCQYLHQYYDKMSAEWGTHMGATQATE
jgi:DNA-directed RNA polymerase subunit L/DNA-directed RNA polymerase alpha subunit